MAVNLPIAIAEVCGDACEVIVSRYRPDKIFFEEVNHWGFTALKGDQVGSPAATKTPTSDR